jgi:hypothetical protein
MLALKRSFALSPSQPGGVGAGVDTPGGVTVAAAGVVDVVSVAGAAGTASEVLVGAASEAGGALEAGGASEVGGASEAG